MTKAKQGSLLDEEIKDLIGCESSNEWVGMPEFVQKKQSPYAQIIFRFETEDDLADFAKIIGQKLTGKTKSCWHPYRSHFSGDKSVWVDES